MKVVDIFPHSGKANKIFPDSGKSSKNGGKMFPDSEKDDKMFPDSDKGKDKRLKSDADSLDWVSDLSRHVETVCLLINQNAKEKHHVNVGIDAEDYYKIKEGK